MHSRRLLLSLSQARRSLCPLINPPALSYITGIDGEIVQKEVFAAAGTVAENTTFGDLLELGNQKGVSLLATA